MSAVLTVLLTFAYMLIGACITTWLDKRTAQENDGKRTLRADWGYVALIIAWPVSLTLFVIVRIPLPFGRAR